MAGQSLFERFELLAAASVMSANSVAHEKGFRQRDVRWIIEYFANWLESTLDEETFPFQNTQISRYLDGLVREGFSRKTRRKGLPRYFLTRGGVIELLSRIVSQHSYYLNEHFFFAHFFLRNYRKMLIRTVKAQGERFPYALELELESLTDVGKLIEERLSHTVRELKKVERRIEDQKAMSEYTTRLLTQGFNYQELAERVQLRFPFALYTKKSLFPVIPKATERQGLWEMQEAGLLRNEQMWELEREALLLHIKHLKQLQDIPEDYGGVP